MADRSEAVLLDIDGTLIDSNDAHARAWVDVGAEFGQPIAFDEVRWLIGMGGDRVLPRLTGLDDESDDGARMVERRGEIFRDRYLPQLSAFPGARELLKRMRADGYRLVVATSASQTDLKAMLKQTGLAEMFHASTDSDDAEQSKPAPDIVEAALEAAGVDAHDAIMLGDTPYDVEAAHRAGVRIVAVRCGGWKDDDLAGAAAIYDSPAHILQEYDSSPFAR